MIQQAFIDMENMFDLFQQKRQVMGIWIINERVQLAYGASSTSFLGSLFSAFIVVY